MNTNMTEQFITLHFNDGVTLQLSTSSFLYKNSSFLQLFDIEEDNNIPIICPNLYVLDNDNIFYFNDKDDLLFMFTLDTTIFINLCYFLDIIEYETNDVINKQFILYVMKHNLIHQLKYLHVFMCAEIKSILNYTENISADIQVRTCTSLFYNLYLSEYKEEVIKNNRIDIYELSIYKIEYYKYINKYDNHLTYIVKETQKYKDYLINISKQLYYVCSVLHINCKINNNEQQDTLEVIKCLVEQGANINFQNKDGNTILHEIILYNSTKQNNNIEIIRYIVEHGANIYLYNNNGNTILHCALCQNIDIEIIKYLIEHEAKNTDFINLPTKDEYTPLHIACNRPNNLEVIQYLIEHGANINDYTQLHIALNKQYNFKVIQYLIEYCIKCGIDINLQNKHKYTLLHCASKIENNIEVIKYLIEQNIYVNLKTDIGNTALHHAAGIKNNLEVIKYIVEHGANVNLQNKYGNTALHEACELYDNIKVVQYLVEYGADINIKNKYRNTALQKSRDKIVINYLQQFI